MVTRYACKEKQPPSCHSPPRPLHNGSKERSAAQPAAVRGELRSHRGTAHAHNQKPPRRAALTECK